MTQVTDEMTSIETRATEFDETREDALERVDRIKREYEQIRRKIEDDNSGSSILMQNAFRKVLAKRHFKRRD